MATIEENLQRWSTYTWDEGGDEWSQAWGGTPFLWHAALYPRLMALLPARRILEIAPGYGRFTRYLKDLCGELHVVDLTTECIEACRNRFRDAVNVRYHVNDGKSLDFLEDRSIDLAFSFDSLVHAEKDVLHAYLEQLSRKLSDDGVGFLHHSNIGAYRDAESGDLVCENPHWRGESMSAKLFREYCAEHSLVCVRQELIDWGMPAPAPLTDAFSIFTRPGSRFERPFELRENGGFMAEAFSIQCLANHYGVLDPGPSATGGTRGP